MDTTLGRAAWHYQWHAITERPGQHVESNVGKLPHPLEMLGEDGEPACQNNIRVFGMTHSQQKVLTALAQHLDQSRGGVASHPPKTLHRGYERKASERKVGYIRGSQVTLPRPK